MAAGAWESSRKYRIGRAVQEALAQVLGGDVLRDPALRESKVTILEVRMSSDLRHADVFVLPFGLDSAQTASDLLQRLAKAAPFLAGEVARRARLRYAPRLHFLLDRQLDHASDLNRLLDGSSRADAA